MPSIFITRIARAGLILSLIGITILSLIPVQSSLGLNIWDKAQHAGAYLYLTLLACAASTPCHLTGRHASLLMAYGIGIEVLQSGLPWRSFSLLDMVANASGILMGGAFLTLLTTIKAVKCAETKEK